ncbi:MAG: hypothetical protein VXY77_02275 [Pseudomonadota bacterium]|nr:hypothetical protein [Pseudomonadota bacterium]
MIHLDKQTICQLVCCLSQNKPLKTLASSIGLSIQTVKKAKNGQVISSSSTHKILNYYLITKRLLKVPNKTSYH